MLRVLKEIKGYKVGAIDDDFGSVRDVLFDDEGWIVRYLVVAAGPWLFGRRVLIGWPALGEPDWTERRFPVSLTKEQVKEAPSIDADAPVSRRMERELFGYYGWDPYWAPAATLPPKTLETKDNWDIDEVHLRSLNEVTGYYVQAADGEIGHVEDLIVDDERWDIRYLAIDTKNWLPGRKVVIAPDWVESFDWADRRARVNLTKAQIEASPPLHLDEPINRQYEMRLYDFYGRPVNW